MLIISKNKRYWTNLGWTAQKAKERMSECVRNIRFYRSVAQNCKHSYRTINSNLYQKYKFIYLLLSN